jgi:hypothetical protein
MHLAGPRDMEKIMDDRNKLARALSAAVESLSAIDDQAIADEGHALARLLRAFTDRIIRGSSNEYQPPMARNYDRKHWSEAELLSIGLRVPFSPQVYTGGLYFRREKTFHTPECIRSKNGEAMDLETALQRGLKPCEECGGVRCESNAIELSYKIDELARSVDEVRRFVLGDYDGLISVFEASTIMGCSFDELEKECRKCAREQLRKIEDDHFFQIYNGVNVLRYKEHREDRHYSFKVLRQDCVRYSRTLGPLFYMTSRPPAAPTHSRRFGH